MYAIIFSFFFLVVGTFGDFYDMKQTGDTNIRLDIQDLVIYGFGDVDYPLSGESDYTYDYTDMTVKPEAGDKSTTTTSKTPEPTKGELSTSTEPSSSSVASTLTSGTPNITSTTTITTEKPIALQLTQSTAATINKENSTSESNKHPSNMNSETFQIPVVIVTEGKKGYVSSSSIRRKDDDDDTPALPGRKCLQGFYLDGRNRCKPISRKPLHSKEKPKLPNGVRFAQRPSTVVPSP